MKTNIQHLSQKIALLTMLLAMSNLVMAQTELTTTTTTSSAGTVSTFSPDAIAVTTDSSPTPVQYSFSKTTTYVDEDGNPVSVETVKSGLPVTVYYSNDGDRRVATKVVVKRHVSSDGTTIQKTTTTSTTTSTQGLVSSFTPDSMIVNTGSSPTPVSYEFSKTTTYVDENGNPVSVETVKSGVPVTVYYDRDGDRMLATRVVVRTADPTAPIIEEPARIRNQKRKSNHAKDTTAYSHHPARVWLDGANRLRIGRACDDDNYDHHGRNNGSPHSDFSSVK